MDLTHQRIQLVVFDMAGTTVQDDGQVPRAFVEALGASGITVDEQAIVAVRGASKREAVRHFVPTGPGHDEAADTIYGAFCTRLVKRFRDEGVRAVPGAEATFAALRANGVKVAITTGFDRDIQTFLLDALGWSNAVADVFVCLDDVRNGRPAPDLIHCAMARAGITDAGRVAAVGDTTLDLEAGVRAGVGLNIGVLTGGHDRARLERAPHSHILASVADVPAVILSVSERPT